MQIIDILEIISHNIVWFLKNQTLYSLLLLLPVVGMSILFKKRNPYLQLGIWGLLFIRLIIWPDWSTEFNARQLLSSLLGSEQQILLQDNFYIEDEMLLETTGLFITGSGNKSGFINLLSIEFLIFTFWMVPVIILFVHYRRKKRYFTRIVWSAHDLDSSQIKYFLYIWKRKFGIKRHVKIVSSAVYQKPFTCGIINPVIFLPMDVYQKCNYNMIESIIAHEMAHIKRFDDFWIQLQSMIQIIYFFNPVVWLAASRLNQVREEICDHLVLSGGRLTPKSYGKALLDIIQLNLLTNQRTVLLPGIGSEKNKMKSRIRKLRGGNTLQKKNILFISIFIVITGLFLLPMATASNSTNGLNQSMIDGSNSSVQFELPIKNGHVSSPFGMRMHPVKKVKMQHNGIDVAAKKGIPIYAAAEGIVESVVNEKKNAYGLFVVIRHKDEYKTHYSQMNSIVVETGDKLKAGQQIGTVGNSGVNTGSHLHFEIRKGETFLNPEDYIDFSGLKRK